MSDGELMFLAWPSVHVSLTSKQPTGVPATVPSCMGLQSELLSS